VPDRQAPVNDRYTTFTYDVGTGAMKSECAGITRGQPANTRTDRLQNAIGEVMVGLKSDCRHGLS
jgi:hypothetical protein